MLLPNPMFDPQNLQIVVTADGSHSLRLPDMDESYHSTHGALAESRHVFIKNGLQAWLAVNRQAREVHILEYGFGTGLNALLTCLLDTPVSLVYHSLENHPLPASLTARLNYGTLLHAEETFQRLHAAPWNSEVEIRPGFTLHKIRCDFIDYRHTGPCQVIYFDAFAPGKQPEVWQTDILQHCHDVLSKGGVWVSYSARGQLKRDLAAAGFEVETLVGPPGKKEMTRGWKR
ncbi:MAG TPA: methyltransferase [Flammeovirgaceae bacterium]|nr:methyltransferase [Flammeovirgaceae bacterium]